MTWSVLSGLSGLAAPVAHIVYIGAGAGTDLAACLAACRPGAGTTITLIGGDDDAISVLAAQAAGHRKNGPAITVTGAAVSADPQPRAYHRTNAPAFDSFLPPAPLMKTLFPGLRVLSRDPVSPADPVALIDGLGIGADQASLLILDVPGETLGILRALDGAGMLTRFGTIALREMTEPVYLGAPAFADIRACLTGLGYWAGLGDDKGAGDPLRPWLTARLDPDLADSRRLSALREADLADLQVRHGQVLQDIADRDALLARLAVSLDSAAQYFRDRNDGRDEGPDA